ncbi:hypothetical protein K456DRAFT_844497 [Colletotrichum gloeosporioides 23]|nr:hypothetical protein K456DRAFT_844497 [Colletotrichum gloeosporioides 23]
MEAPIPPLPYTQSPKPSTIRIVARDMQQTSPHDQARANRTNHHRTRMHQGVGGPGRLPPPPPEKEGALRFGRCEGRESVWLQYRQPGSRKKLVCRENGGLRVPAVWGWFIPMELFVSHLFPYSREEGGMTAWGFTALAARPSVSARAASLLRCIAGAGETSGPQAAQLTQPSAPPFSPPHHRCAPSTASEGGDDVFVSCLLLLLGRGPKYLDEGSVTAVAYSKFPGGAEC